MVQQAQADAAVARQQQAHAETAKALKVSYFSFLFAYIPLGRCSRICKVGAPSLHQYDEHASQPFSSNPCASAAQAAMGGSKLFSSPAASSSFAPLAVLRELPWNGTC